MNLKNLALFTAIQLGMFTSIVTLPTKAQSAPTGEVALSWLDVSRAIQTWGRSGKDVSVTGKPLTIKGQRFESGFGTHSSSRLFVRLNGKATTFTASVGIDDAAAAQGSVEFKVIGDGKALWSSGIIRHGEAAKAVSVDVTGIQYLTLSVTDAGDGISFDHADWADARFKGVSGPLEVVERLPEDKEKIVPGAAWRDTDNYPIQAHGGGIMAHEGKYYWYGEDRSRGYVGVGVSGYVSEDLVTWKNMGLVLPKVSYDEKWKELTINERPKVAYNTRTKKFVMWFHYDRASYWDSQAGVAIADKPEGPFKYLGMHRPIEKSTYRDMNLFVDDDGHAYAIYAGEENFTMHIVRLNEEWTAPEQPMVEGKTWIRTLIRAHREAPAPFKYNGKYYMITSAATGWDPNAANYAVADSMLGDWKMMPNPFKGAASEITFGSQSTYVLPVAGKPGRFIYMGDRWNPSNLMDARYVWLPFQMKTDGTFEIQWRDSWSPKDWPLTPIAANPLPNQASENKPNGFQPVSHEGGARQMNSAVAVQTNFNKNNLAPFTLGGNVADSKAANGGFLFVTFRGEATPLTEQVYFATSRDGRNWEAPNGNEPTLTSQLGEKGVRDPYILRSADGKKFYIIATDLSINLNPDWGRAVRRGSGSLVIWESNDLVNWSEPRLVKVAPDDAGCAWAPEAIYDEERGEYMVFWASTNQSDNFAKHRIWASRTKDFKTFGEPFIYIDRPAGIIDTTIVHSGGKYHRFSKDERSKSITFEESDNLMGPWNSVNGFSLAALNGYEGPQCFLLEPEKAGSPAKWCLLLDYYSRGQGYQPFLTTDLTGGKFEAVSDFKFPFRFRHGSVLRITSEELNRIQARQ